MHIWAIADLHLANGIPEKKMDFFGEPWINYTEKIAQNWNKLISNDDLVLIPGDISWAMKPEDAKIDLDYIEALPGKKILLKGNHDYWWSSLAQVKKILPPSIHLIQNNVFNWENVTIGGTRLWDTNEYNFNEWIQFTPNPRAKKLVEGSQDQGETERIFEKELARLEMSLKQLDPHAKIRIALTHYPPIGHDLQPSKVSSILEKYQIDHCIFGHLHNIKKGSSLFGEKRGIHYHLVSADYLDFIPKKIF